MKEYVFHSFTMGDVDDPEIYAAMPIHEWEQTEQGQWIMEHCPEPRFRFCHHPQSWGHKVEIYGTLDDKHGVAFLLKWGNK